MAVIRHGALVYTHYIKGYCGYTFLPSYPLEVMHLKVGIFAPLPTCAGVIGTPCRWVVEWLLARTGSIKLAHRLVAVVGLLGCVACIVAAALVVNAYAAVEPDRGLLFLECAIAPSLDFGNAYGWQMFRDSVGRDEHAREHRWRTVA